MNSFQRNIILIIDSALTGKKYDISSDFELERSAMLAIKHKIEVIFFYGAINCGIDSDLPIMQKLFIGTCANISQVKNQEFEINKIMDAFNSEKIKYMPLKGTYIRNMFPKPEMRFMCDADILIDKEQYNSISKIMQELGYTQTDVNDHDISWMKSKMHIELHHRLFQTFNKDYYSFYGDGWKLAKIQSGTRYCMTDEDNFVYLFVHFCKHYRSTGIGIKQIIDLYVFMKNKPNLNKVYLDNELKKLGLIEFYNNVMNTLGVWFDNKEETDITNFITDTIFESGVYGTNKNYILSETLKNSREDGSVGKTKIKQIVFSVFLPYKDMCEKYTFLKKVPVMLPIMWIARFCSFLKDKEKMKKYTQKYECLTTQNVNKYEKALRYVGLDFNFDKEEKG